MKDHQIVVAGIGGTGIEVVKRLVAIYEGKIKPIFVDTDIRQITFLCEDECIILGKHHTYGFPASSVEVAQVLAEEEFKNIPSLIDSQGIFIVVAGLGGNTGSGVAPVLLKRVFELGGLSTAILTIPAQFEGEAKIQKAKRALQRIQSVSHLSLLISIQKLLGGSNISIMGLLDRLTEAVMLDIDILWSLFNSKCIFKVNWNEFRTHLLKNRLICLPFSISLADIKSFKADSLLDILIQNVGSKMLEICETVFTIVHIPDRGEIHDLIKLLEECKKLFNHKYYSCCISESLAPINLPKVSFIFAIKDRIDDIEEATYGIRPGQDPERYTEEMVQSLEFEKYIKELFPLSVPSVYDGQNLDIPTYLRKGVKIE